MQNEVFHFLKTYVESGLLLQKVFSLVMQLSHNMNEVGQV